MAFDGMQLAHRARDPLIVQLQLQYSVYYDRLHIRCHKLIGEQRSLKTKGTTIPMAIVHQIIYINQEDDIIRRGEPSLMASAVLQGFINL